MQAVMSVARVATVPFFIKTQLESQIKDLHEFGCDVTVVSSRDEAFSSEFENSIYFNYVPIEIPRKISILKDAICLYKLWALFKRNSYDVVHSTTPKAGLLCSLAALMAGVPVRLHTFTGQTWVHMGWFSKVILRSFDKLIVRLNTHCYADSPSQCEFLISNNVGAAGDISVVGYGSLAGVSTSRFDRRNRSCRDVLKLKSEIINNPKAFVLLFVGRVTKDKGIYELLSAFNKLVLAGANIELVVVGPLDENKSTLEYLVESNISVGALVKDSIHWVGFSSEPEKFMAFSDLICLPSYREGFGSVIIEAALMGLPAIVSDIYGLSDAVVHEETGILVPARDVDCFVDVVQDLMQDKCKLERMSDAAEARAKSLFSSTLVSKLLINEYSRLLGVSR